MKNRIYTYFLSEKVKLLIERITIYSSIAGFLIHLILIELVALHILESGAHNGLLLNPISAIYTPFSFILVYEVYLLIFYLPKSFSKYIGKQYEIITLIIIRRVFKDLASLNFSDELMLRKVITNFMYDLLSVLILFFLIIIFYHLSKGRVRANDGEAKEKGELVDFVNTKKLIAILLVPIFVGLTVYSFSTWLIETIHFTNDLLHAASDINKIFFDQFFTILILSDVLLLLLSLVNSDKFSIVMRNSGFVISTVLIKISFGVTGILNNLLIVTALLFGVLILFLHNQFNRLDQSGEPL